MIYLEMALTINPIAFEIGGLQVRWYGIIIAFGIYLATTLADREATRKGYRKDFIIDLVFWAVPLGFVGARLYYILFEWQYYFSKSSRNYSNLAWWYCNLRGESLQGLQRSIGLLKKRKFLLRYFLIFWPLLYCWLSQLVAGGTLRIKRPMERLQPVLS